MHKFVNKYNKLPKQVKASFWFLICSFMQKGISAISTPIFTRLMSTAEYGQFNNFLSWESILRVLITLNLFYGIYTSGLVKYKERRPEFVSALQGLTLSLVFLWYIIYFIFNDFFNELFSLTTTQMVCLIGQVWTTAVFSFWAAEQRVEYEYRRLVLITIVVSIAKPLVGVILITHFADKVTARIVGLFIVELVSYGWMLIAQVKRHPKLYSSFFWRYALKFNIPLIPHYLAQNILSSSDRIMIIRMISDEKAGIYSLAYSISLIMNLFNTALTQTIGPWVYERIKSRREEEISRIINPAIVSIAVVNFLLIVFAPEVVHVFAPTAYHEAIWTIPPVTMSVYFIFLYNMFSYYEFYYEKTAFIAAATMIAALLNLILNYVCIQVFGYIAAGYTTLACYILYALGHYFVMKKIAHEYLDDHSIIAAKKVALITICFMSASFFVMVFYEHIIIRYLLLALFITIAIGFRRRITGFLSMLFNIRKNG